MKKILGFLSVLVLLSMHGKSQDLIPLGDYTQEEMDMKDCSFDKDAEAVVLLREGHSGYDEMHHLITYYHVKIKILKDKGVHRGNVTIRFYRSNDFEYIDEINGLVSNKNADGQWTSVPLERKSVYYQNINEYWGSVKLAFPDVKAGSIIDYNYRSNMKNYGGLEDWAFQEDIPVVVSRYKLVIIPYAEFAYQVHNAARLPVDIKKQSDGGGISFEMKNIPGLENEAYMDARRDYLQRVTFQLSLYTGNGYQQKYLNSWNDVSKELLGNSFGSQLNKSFSGTDELINGVKQLQSLPQRMQRIYDYVSSNMAYNGYTTRFSPDGVKSAWNKKSGTSGDINLILVNLLRDAGLDAEPMLVSERDHGRVYTQYPFVDQFNSVYAMVTIGSRKYFLDATNKYTPAQITPVDVLNTIGYVVSRKSGGLVNITEDSISYRDLYILDVKMINPGKLEGTATVTSEDYAKIRRVREMKHNSREYQNENFEETAAGVSINNLETANEDSASLPLVHKFNFSLPVTTTGDYSFISLNLFSSDLNKNPFQSDKRFSNINFGYKRTIAQNVTIDIPADYTVDVIPKSIKMVTPDKGVSFQRRAAAEGGKIYVITVLSVNTTYYEVDDYPVLKEFYKKMFEFLNEQIVLKKK